MNNASFHSGRSALDEAHESRLEERTEDALRGALAVLASGSSEELGAASLIAQLLVEAGRNDAAGDAAERLVDSFVRRGDLPEAVVASIIAEQAGRDGAKLRKEIAAAFGAGSPRVADVTQAPPPLPHEATITTELAALEEGELLEHAETMLRELFEIEETVDPRSKVPRLPLFSALPPRELARLLDELELRDVKTGGHVVRQGEEGREAFVVVRGVAEVFRSEESTKTTLAALGPGAIFGEMALVSDAPRAGSVVAVEPTRLLVAAREHLEALAQNEPAIGRELGAFSRSRMIANLMRHSMILRAVESKERSELISQFETRTFEPGKYLLRQGDEATALFLVASGQVEVVGKDADGDELRIATLGPGDVVGEISLVLRRPANADVIATHPTVALELTSASFQAAIRKYPELLRELYELAVKREEETRTVVAQEAFDVEDVVLL